MVESVLRYASHDCDENHSLCGYMLLTVWVHSKNESVHYILF